MRKQIFTLILILSFSLVACNNGDNKQIDTDNIQDSQAENEMFTEAETKALVALQETTVIPIEQVTANAESMMLVFDDGIDRQIKEVKSFDYELPGTGARSDSFPDSIPIHVFNFDNDAGFVLIAGDARINGNLAISSTGNFDPDTTIDNPGFAIFMSSVPGNIKYEIDKYNQAKQEPKNLDSIKEKIFNEFSDDVKKEIGAFENLNFNNNITNSKRSRGIFDNYDFQQPAGVVVYIVEIQLRDSDSIITGPWTNYIKYGNFVKVNWGQRYPENSKIKKIPNYCINFIDSKELTERSLTGCGAVAAAMLMSTHKKPIEYEKVTLYLTNPDGTKTPIELDKLVYNWQEMTAKELAIDLPKEYRNQVALLMKKLGKDMEMVYGCLSSYTYEDYFKYAMQIWGYRPFGLPIRLQNPYYASYNLGTVKDSLRYGKSLIASGYKIETDYLFFAVPDEGHFWVIDGYLKQKKIITHRTNTYRVSPTGTMTLIAVVDINTAQYREFVHCNWGWYGDYNGYFKSGVFDSHNPVIEDRANSESYFRYEKKIMPYLGYPNQTIQ